MPTTGVDGRLMAATTGISWVADVSGPACVAPRDRPYFVFRAYVRMALRLHEETRW